MFKLVFLHLDVSMRFLEELAVTSEGHMVENQLMNVPMTFFHFSSLEMYFCHKVRELPKYFSGRHEL